MYRIANAIGKFILITVVGIALIGYVVVEWGGGGGDSGAASQPRTEAPPPPQAIMGKLRITRAAVANVDGEYGDECRGTGELADIVRRAPIVARDAAGRILAEGHLGIALFHEAEPTACVWWFVVDNVPDSASYTLSFGDHDGPTYSHDDLDAAGWIVELTLGS